MINNELYGDFKSEIIDKANKVARLTFIGYFNNECAAKFFTGYTEAKRLCSGGTLQIEAIELKPFPQEALDAAGQIYRDYVADFSKIEFVLPKNIVAKKQTQRILKDNKIEDKFKILAKF